MDEFAYREKAAPYRTEPSLPETCALPAPFQSSGQQASADQQFAQRQQNSPAGERRKGSYTSHQVTIAASLFATAAPHCPDGFGITACVDTGSPKFGVPSAFHVNGCIRGERDLPHPCCDSALAW